MLRIHLFGIPRLAADGVPIKFAARPRTWPLLAYLLLHRQLAVPREPAAYLLWPDLAENEARANLRRHLNELQKHLPPEPAGRPWVVAQSATIRFNPDAVYWLDVAEFERLSSVPESLADAVNLYAGDLLENASDDWVYSERERFRSAYLAALSQLIHLKRSRRDFSEALRYAERLLVHDSLREDAARLVMAVRYEAGDRAGALQAFEHFAVRLREELDVDPMPETAALRDAILRNAAIPGVGDAGPIREDGEPARAALPFVGRETEMDQLRSWWSRAARGRGQAVFVGGEAGIGKTRLVAELAQLAQTQGARVLTGGTAFAEATPYQSIAEAVRSAVPLIASLPMDATRLAVLRPLVPELQASGAQTQSLSLAPLETEREQIRLFEALAACLEGLASPRPLLLILEDLHWAGAATIAALKFLARRSTRHCILIVATYRDEEISRAHPLREARRRLQQEKALGHLSLSRLPLDAVETLVARVPELATRSGDLTRRLYQESEGNPFFLGEVIRDLVEVEAEPAPASEARAAHAHLPSGVRAAIFSRVARLSAQGRSLSEVAAVIGQAFDVELLREVCGWEERQILDALSELLDRHLAREIGGRSHVDYAFTHHLIQSTIYHALGEDTRKHRHRRVAGVMEELYDDKVDEWAAVLALHWDRGGEPERAAQRYLRAARRALAVFAVDEALGHLDRGLELANADRLRSEMHALRADLRSRRGDRIGQRADLEELDRVAHSLGDEELRFEVLRRRVLLARALGERDVEARLIGALKARAEGDGSLSWQAQALHAEAMHMVLDSRVDDAAAALAKTLTLHRQLGDISGQLECLCTLAELAARRGRLEETHAFLREASECARLLPNPSMIARSMVATARAALIREDGAEAMELGRSALESYRLACDREGEGSALHCMAAAAIGLRQFDVAKQLYEEAVEIYRSIGNRRGLATVLLDTSVIESGLGLLDEAQHSIASAIPIFESLNDLRNLTSCALYLSDFKRISGDLSGAKASALRALDLARTLQLGPLEAAALGNLGDVLRDAGDFSGAIEHLEMAVDMLRGLHRPLDYVEVLAGLSLAYLRAGDRVAARKAADELLAEKASIEGAYRPQYCFWAAAQVYRATGEAPRSAELLRRAYEVMKSSADAISEPATRAAFLKLPFNRELMAAQTRDNWPDDVS